MSFLRALRLGIILCLLCHALPAAAAEINAEGAAKLKAIFESYLAQQNDLSQIKGFAKLDYDGAVTVEQASGYYAVTLPHARVIYPDGGKLDFGMISINASPHDVPGQWKMALAIPTPILMLDAQGKTEMKLNIGAQKAAGIWDENFENFVKLDAQYNDITVDGFDGNMALHIPDARVLYNFDKDPDGRWSGPGSITLKNISGIFGHEKSGAKIAELKADFSMDRYNPAALKEYRAKLAALMKDVAASVPPGTTAPLDPARGAAMGDMLTNLFLNGFNGVKAEYAASGVEVTYPDPATKTPQTLKLGKGFFGVSMEGFMAEKAGMIIRFGYDGFALAPVPPGYEGVLPSTANIHFDFRDIPTRQLAEAGKNAAVGAAQQPEMAPLAGMSFLMKAPAILAQSGATLNVNNNYIGNDEYRMDVNGALKADINAVNNFTGQFKGVFKGLEKLIAKVGAVAADPKHPAAQNAQGLLGSLESLKAQGKPETGPDGHPVHTYELIITPQGQITLNGQPMMGATAPLPPTVAPAP